MRITGKQSNVRPALAGKAKRNMKYEYREVNKDCLLPHVHATVIAESLTDAVRQLNISKEIADKLLANWREGYAYTKSQKYDYTGYHLEEIE